MKKTALLLAIALFAVTFTSCQKTKPYNPKEKISKIYVGLGLEKNLSEAWNWEGNQLKSIEHYISIDNVQLNYYTEVFTYNDKGQVQNVKTEDGDFYTEYLYGTNDRLYQVNCYLTSENKPIMYMFEYDDNKLSEITVVGKDIDMTDVKASSSSMKYVLPEILLTPIEKALNNKPMERGEKNIEMDIEWHGKNISEIDVEYGNYSEKHYFSYDNYQNPFRNFFSIDVDDLCTFANKNNVVAITSVSSY
ncbi:MAG: hypothetical protein IIX06_02560, partial [Bacteroidales bacterium]|nr:hypothetical protein [Bacteroidales bacterium]